MLLRSRLRRLARTLLHLEALETRILPSSASIPALLLLDPSSSGALTVTGNGSVQASGGGGVVIDSKSPQAARATGNGGVSAAEIDITGQPGFATTGHAEFQGTIHGGVTPAADPLAGLPVPQAPAPTYAAVNYSGSAPLTLSPGTYVGGIRITGKGSVTLLPGLYYLQGGGFSVTGQGGVSGDGVLIYNAPRGASDGIAFSGKGAVRLTPSTAGTYQDITVFQDRTSAAPLNITGNGNVNITGTVYAPRAALYIAGNAGFVAPALASAVNEAIFYGLNVSGNGSFQTDARFNQPLTLTIALSPPPRTTPAGLLVTNVAQSTIQGMTNPGATVQLETGTDGLFDEGKTTADASGRYSFSVTLVNGLNTLQVRATENAQEGDSDSDSDEEQNDEHGLADGGTHPTDSHSSSEEDDDDDEDTEEGVRQKTVAQQVILDTVPPVITVTSPTPNLITNHNVTVIGQVTDDRSGVASLKAALDGGVSVPIPFDASGNFSIPTGLPDGTHTEQLQATDWAGNQSSFTVSFTLDTVPPVITVTSPTPNLITNHNVMVSGQVMDDRSGVGSLQAALDGGAYVPVAFDTSGNFSFPTNLPLDHTADGMHSEQLQAMDRAGNVSSVTVSFTLDTVPPVITVTSPAQGLTSSTNVTITGSVTDALSGVARLSVAADGGPYGSLVFDASGMFSFTTAYPLDGTADGMHVIHFDATDMAGNVSAVTNYTFTLSSSCPPYEMFGDWTPGQDGGSATGHGSVDIPDCGATLHEGDSFDVTLGKSFVIPSQPSVLTFTYSNLSFDALVANEPRDAFEAAFVDAGGNSLVHTITGSRDAFFNLTEGLSAATGNDAAASGQTVTLDLAQITPGTTATLIFRLVNNDGPGNSSVMLNSVQITPGPGTGSPANPSASPVTSRSIDFSQLSDVTASVQPVYGQTSLDAQTNVLYADLSARNAGHYSVGVPLVAVIDHLSDPSVRVRGADGMTPDGRPYFDFSSLVSAGKLSAGSETGSRTLAFYDPNDIPFTYDVVFLGQLNLSPVFTSKPNTQALVGLPYVYHAMASDPDGDPLTFSLVAGPAGMAVDGTTGQVTWGATAANIGNQSVVLRVDDGRGGWATQQYTLSVINSPPNQPPMFTSVPVVSANVNTAYTYPATATDPDGDPVTFSVASGPTGLTIDASSGVVRWTPTAAQVGTANVTLSASDGHGGIATQAYTILVAQEAGNLPPVIVSQPVTSVALGQPYRYQVSAIDPDGDPLTYSLTQSAAGMAIDPSTGLVQWVQPADILSSNAVTFTDGTFNPANWQFSYYRSGNPQTSASVQTINSGGNPGAYRLTSVDIYLSPNVGGMIATFDMQTGAIYDPKLNGAVFSIDYSTDAIAPGISTQVGAALIQDGKTYGGPIITAAYSGNQWLSLASADLNAEDFQLIDPSQTSLLDPNQHPDFSSNADPIELGYWQYGGFVLGSGHYGSGPLDGVDNWKCVVNPMPENPVAVRVEDGRGGFDTQAFTLGVNPPAKIQGSVYNDLNGDGQWNRGPDLVVNGGTSDPYLRYSIATGTFIAPLVYQDQLPSSYTAGAAFGPDGLLYVPAVGTNAVYRVDPQTGLFLDTFASQGPLETPTALAFGPDGNLYVFNLGTHSVLKYNRTTGAYVGNFASTSGLISSQGMRFGPDGNLYVVDSNHTPDAIYRFNGTTGAYLSTINETGGIDVAFGPDGNLYTEVRNSGSGGLNGVVKYNPQTGAFLGYFLTLLVQRH